MTARTDTDVLIVGAGPAGISLGLALARAGVRSIILERYGKGNPHPRAHYINTRTMELFRLWGIDDAIRSSAYPPDHLPFDMLVPLGGISMEERRSISPVTVQSCAQDRVEAALSAALAEHPESSLRRGQTLIGLDDSGDSVTATFSNLDSGVETLTARWLVGADGAASTVRDLIGVGLVGDRNLAAMVNIYFEGRLQPEGEVPPLGMVASNPDVAAAFVSMDGDRRWCCHYSGDDLDAVEGLDETAAAALIRRAADLADDQPIHVHSISRWTMTAVVAERMRVGSVFLVGDSAHAFPPTGGFGMNSGIQDAHNLAWKLASVLRGTAGEALLDSYEQERLPIAYLNTAQSLRNAHRGSTSETASPDAELIESRASRSVQSQVAVATTVEDHDRFEILEHNAAIGQDLGFAYDTSAVISPDDSTGPDIWVAQYTPNARPGARAPHVPLRRADGSVVSTIDLFDGVFTLLTSTDSGAWKHAVESLPAELRPRVISVGWDEFQPVDADFETFYRIGPTGAVLVRPDGHVAYRAAAAPDDAAGDLHQAVRVALGVAVA